MRWIGAILLAFAAIVPSSANAQAKVELPQNAERDVRAADDALWRAFDACDAAALSRLFAEDVEFYHDITGLTRGRQAVVASLINGPCGAPGFHMRREAITASVRYDPVPGYGAMISGQHLFYARNGGAAELPVTKARFVTVWRFADGRWQVARVISFDHESLEYKAPVGIALSPAEQGRYVGRYRAEGQGDISITVEDGELMLHSGGLMVTLRAASRDHLFAVERDLHFDFSGAGTAADRIEVRENGRVVAKGVRATAGQ